jgi:hypothetical protein
MEAKSRTTLVEIEILNDRRVISILEDQTPNIDRLIL